MVGVGPFTENLNIIYKYLFVYKITDNFEHNNRNRSIKELKAEAKNVVTQDILNLIKLS